jgi:hypothetical protein
LVGQNTEVAALMMLNASHPQVVTNDLLNAAKSSYTNFRMTSLLIKMSLD